MLYSLVFDTLFLGGYSAGGNYEFIPRGKVQIKGHNVTQKLEADK